MDQHTGQQAGNGSQTKGSGFGSGLFSFQLRSSSVITSGGRPP